jgi:hypothetical protein
MTVLKVDFIIKLEQFRKIIDSKPKTTTTRNNLFNKQAFIKKLNNAPLNVTENTQTNYASLLLSHIKSRNQENIYKPVEAMPQTNIVKITYSKLSYKNGVAKKPDKPGIGVTNSYINDTLYRTNISNSKNKVVEKANPVVVSSVKNK